jgi:hypothetical protein
LINRKGGLKIPSKVLESENPKKFSTEVIQKVLAKTGTKIFLTDFVINKSSCTFTEEEILPKALVDIIASIESGIQYLPDNVNLDVRNGVKKIIKRKT